MNEPSQAFLASQASSTKELGAIIDEGKSSAINKEKKGESVFEDPLIRPYMNKC